MRIKSFRSGHAAARTRNMGESMRRECRTAACLTTPATERGKRCAERLGVPSSEGWAKVRCIHLHPPFREEYSARLLGIVAAPWGGGSTLTSWSVPRTSPGGWACGGCRTSTTSNGPTRAFPSPSSASGSPAVAATSGTGRTWRSGHRETDAWSGRGGKRPTTPAGGDASWSERQCPQRA